MKSKSNDYFGCGTFITELQWWWNECSYISLYCYFNCISIMLYFTNKEGCSWWEKSKSLKLQLCWWKVMCWQWHWMGHFIPVQLTCRPQLYYTFPRLEDFSYGQWMWEACSNEQHLLSKSWCSAWEHRLCFLHCILTCLSASSLSYHFGSRFLVTTWSQFLQLLRTGAEIWAQLCSCPECWVHTVCCWWSWPKHKFTGCPHTMKWMIMQTFYWVGPQPGESYAELWKWMSYKLLATFRSAIPFHFLWG